MTVAPNAEPPSPLVVGVRVRYADSPPPPWYDALVARVAAHPALELRALVREPRRPATGGPGEDPGHASRIGAASGPAESVTQALLRTIDRPQNPARDGGASAGPSPDTRNDPAGRAEGADLASCDVVLEIGLPGAPRQVADPAPGVRTWCVDARRIEAEIEATLLGGFDLGDLVLPERRVRGRSPDDADEERAHAVHTLPVQSFSRSDRLAAAFGALPDFVTGALTRLAAGVPEPPADADRLAARARLLPADLSGEPRRANGRRLRAACRLVMRQLAVRVRDRFSEERWELAWHPDPPTAASPVEAAQGAACRSVPATPGIDVLLRRPVSAWRPLLYAADHLRADPHALAGPDGIELWFEDLPADRDHGHVGHAGFAPFTGVGDGLAPRAADGEPGPVLESGHHLSYPFAFEHDGARLMVPETAQAGRVELYRQAPGAPRRWTFERALLTGLDVTDTTLVHRDGRWWLFTNAMSHRAVDERDLLLLHHAGSLDGPWTPHPLNPIVRGVAGARMAGALFELDGVLVRPSQYGGRRYGHGLNLNRVDALDVRRYAETPLGRIVPAHGDGWLGLHSISLAGGVAFVDRLRRRPRPGPAGALARVAERAADALGSGRRGGARGLG